MGKTGAFVNSAKQALTSRSVSFLNFTQEDCDIAYFATTNPLMQTIRVVHLFFCILGLIVSSVFVFVLLSRSSRNLHVNLRLSLASLSLAAWIACAQILFSAVYNLSRILSDNEHCGALRDSYGCAIVRFPIVLSIYSTLCGIFVLAVERTIATIKYKTYEVHGSRIVAFVLISVQWLLSIFFACVSSYVRTEPGFVHYCTVYVSHPTSAVFSLCVMSVLEAGALLYFVLLLQSNKQRQVNEFVNNAMHTLTERYQLQENVRIMSILIPSVTVHAGMGLVGLVSMLAFALAHRSDSGKMLVRFAPFSELVLLVVPVYAIVFPLVAILWNKQMRHASKRALPCIFNLAELESVEKERAQRHREQRNDHRQLEKDSDAHFELLNDMWSK